MEGSAPTILQIMTALGSVATPVLLAVFSAIGWAIKRKIEATQRAEERARRLEEELREDRLKVYNQVLEPFIIIFTKDEGIAAEKAYKGKKKETLAQEKILSVSYRQAVFKLSLFASDEVVRSYNEMMQFFYAQAEPSASDLEGATVKLMDLFGAFLLAIRKSVGNETTKLDNLAMLEWLVSDIRKLKSQRGQ